MVRKEKYRYLFTKRFEKKIVNKIGIDGKFLNIRSFIGRDIDRASVRTQHNDVDFSIHKCIHMCTHNY